MKVDKFKVQIAMANSVISLSELSKKSKISYAALVRLMNGQTKPNPATVGKLAQALDVPVTEIIEDFE